MASFKKEWKVNRVSRDDLNEQLYTGIDPFLNPCIADPATHSKAYDAKLLIRELVDNIYKHDSAFAIRLEVELSGTRIKFRIMHNGSEFDPFSVNSNCDLIKKIKQDISFIPSFVPTDSGRRSMTIEFDLL